MINLRTKDTYLKSIYNFITDIFVVCPKCNRQAIVKTSGDFLKNYGGDVKAVCVHCGFNKDFKGERNVIASGHYKDTVVGKQLVIGASIDPFFHLPLWLRIECEKNELWAYNYEHLEFLSKHIQAQLKERNTVLTYNTSLGSRLPKWMTTKKNREKVLKCIQHLSEK